MWFLYAALEVTLPFNSSFKKQRFEISDLKNNATENTLREKHSANTYLGLNIINNAQR
ncbi:hypothetical protein MAH4_31770 [Sessilibacter sp. MAH4]